MYSADARYPFMVDLCRSCVNKILLAMLEKRTPLSQVIGSIVTQAICGTEYQNAKLHTVHYCPCISHLRMSGVLG